MWKLLYIGAVEKKKRNFRIYYSHQRLELQLQLLLIYLFSETYWQANLESSKNAVKAAELIKGYELLPELWEDKAVFILAGFSAGSLLLWYNK